MAAPNKRTNELLDYLVQTCPLALDKKSSDGDTPLMVACRLGRRQFVRILVKGNADQSTRNLKGENIIHAAVSNFPDAHRLRTLLDELDPDLRKSLFLQRKNLSENGTTPIQAWVSCANFAGFGNQRDYKNREGALVETLRLLLEYSDGQGLDMLSAAGDTSLHTAIMYQQLSVAKVLVDYRPSLLRRENAVGRTPAELAYENLTAKELASPERIVFSRQEDIVGAYARRSAEEFVKESEDKAGDTKKPADRSQVEELGLSGDYTASQVANIRRSMGLAGPEGDRVIRSSTFSRQVMWDLCSTAMSRHPGARRLVSLNEANDVARRLGEQETRSRYFSVNSRRDEDDDDEEEDQDDEKQGDFSITVIGRYGREAWKTVSEVEAKMEGIEKCEECKLYHE